MRIFALCLLVSACGVKSNEPFLVETADCAVVNNFKVQNQATGWNDCRLYWGGADTSMLTVELTTSGTSGSFLVPGADWIRASVQVPAGDVSATLRSIQHPASELPSSVASDKIALDLPMMDCGNVGGSDLTVDTMAEVGDRSASFSMNISGSCIAEGIGTRSFTGGVIVSAAAKVGSTTTSDPATVVGPLP